MSHRILLVDDENDILEFVKYNLEKECFEVYTAQDGAEAIETARRVHPHLILLDVLMPVMNGIEACKAIRADSQISDALVIFLSALDAESQQLSGFDAGADDYLTKPIQLRLLISKVKAMLSRVKSSEKSASGVEIDMAQYVVTLDGEPLVMPRKEFLLLALLHSAPGKLFTREQIYAEVWGSEVVVGDRTIDVHIRKLRQKIGDRHIVTIKGVGYKFEE